MVKLTEKHDYVVPQPRRPHEHITSQQAWKHVRASTNVVTSLVLLFRLRRILSDMSPRQHTDIIERFRALLVRWAAGEEPIALRWAILTNGRYADMSALANAHITGNWHRVAPY